MSKSRKLQIAIVVACLSYMFLMPFVLRREDNNQTKVTTPQQNVFQPAITEPEPNETTHPDPRELELYRHTSYASKMALAVADRMFPDNIASNYQPGRVIQLHDAIKLPPDLNPVDAMQIDRIIDWIVVEPNEYMYVQEVIRTGFDREPVYKVAVIGSNGQNRGVGYLWAYILQDYLVAMAPTYQAQKRAYSQWLTEMLFEEISDDTGWSTTMVKDTSIRGVSDGWDVGRDPTPAEVSERYAIEAERYHLYNPSIQISY